MSTTPAATLYPVMPVLPDSDMESAPDIRLAQMALALATLETELRRSYEQLHLVSQVCSEISASDDPQRIEETLLQSFAVTLRAGAVFVDQAGCCCRVDVADADTRLSRSAADVRDALAARVEATRQARNVQVIERCEALGDAQVLLAAFVREDETGVVIALRALGAPPFAYGDELAASSILDYGAQILRNARMAERMQQTDLETVCALVNAIDAKDNYTSDHSERVGWLARLTGQAMELSQGQLRALEWAGLLHDVGKIGVPEHILNKPGRLTEREFEQMKCHARIGYDMLKPVERFAPVLEAVLHHHENHDGSGYPAGLAGTEIPLEARIIHVVDIFDALTTCRPYRSGYSLEDAFELLHRDAGRVTDPDVTQTMIDALRTCARDDPHVFRAHLEHLVMPQERGPEAHG